VANIGLKKFWRVDFFKNMDIEFKERVHYYGEKCKKDDAHEYGETGQSVRYIKDNHCVLCAREKIKNLSYEQKEKRKETRKKYEEENKERLLKDRMEYNNKNKEKLKIYKMANRNKILEQGKLYRKENADKIKEYQNRPEVKKRKKENSLTYSRTESYKNKIKEKMKDPFVRLNHSMSGGIRSSLKKGQKNKRHWESLVDYTFEDLKKHLEKQFTSEMNWDNYGPFWTLDHIIPLSWFYFETTDDIGFKDAWGLENLQPLEYSLNYKKRNFYIGTRDVVIAKETGKDQENEND
jgi:hypothetical protein